MATQAEVQDLVTQLETIQGDLEAARTTIETELAQVEQNTAGEVDLQPLKEAVAKLTPTAEQLQGVTANPPAAAETTSGAAPAAPATTEAAATTTPDGEGGQTAEATVKGAEAASPEPPPTTEPTTEGQSPAAPSQAATGA